MASNLDQIAYNILSLATGGRPTNNEYITIRRVKDWIHKYRSLYIRRDLDRNRRLREFEQTLPELALQEVIHPYFTGKRTEPLPRLVRLKDNEALTFVGDLDQIKSFQVVDNHSVTWRGYSKLTGTHPFAFVLPDHRVYIVNPPEDQTMVTVRGIFENPEEANGFLVDGELVGEDDYWEYPLPADMIESLTKNILETELTTTQTSPLDTRHDTMPDHKMPQPARQEQ